MSAAVVASPPSTAGAASDSGTASPVVAASGSGSPAPVVAPFHGSGLAAPVVAAPVVAGVNPSPPELMIFRMMKSSRDGAIAAVRCMPDDVCTRLGAFALFVGGVITAVEGGLFLSKDDEVLCPLECVQAGSQSVPDALGSTVLLGEVPVDTATVDTATFPTYHESCSELRRLLGMCLIWILLGGWMILVLTFKLCQRPAWRGYMSDNLIQQAVERLDSRIYDRRAMYGAYCDRLRSGERIPGWFYQEVGQDGKVWFVPRPAMSFALPPFEVVDDQEHGTGFGWFGGFSFWVRLTWCCVLCCCGLTLSLHVLYSVDSHVDRVVIVVISVVLGVLVAVRPFFRSNPSTS